MPAGVSAYVPLASSVTSSSISSFSFSGISQSYRDLVAIVNYSTSGSGGSGYLGAYLNNDFNTGSYTNFQWSGNGSSNSQTTANGQAQMLFANTGTPDGQNCHAILHFMDYSTTNKEKTVIASVGSPQSFCGFGAARWVNNSSVTTVSFRFSGLSIPAGARFELYGVSA
jgi:hypothetical protein